MTTTNYSALHLDNFPAGKHTILWYNHINHFRKTSQDYHIALVLKNLETGELQINYRNLKEIPALSLGAIVENQRLSHETIGKHYSLLLSIPQHSASTKMRQQKQEFFLQQPYFSFEGNETIMTDERTYKLLDRSKEQGFLEYQDESGRNILFPAYVVAQYYYYRSASMIAQVMAYTLKDNNRVKGLYKNCSCDDAGNASIILHPGAANKDAPEIFRFAISDYASMMFHRIYSDLAKSSQMIKERLEKHHISSTHNTGVLSAFFPFHGLSVMRIRGEELADGSILALEIIEENSPYPFENLTVFREHKKYNERLLQMGKIQKKLSAKITEHLNSKRPDQQFDDVTVMATKKQDGRLDLANKDIEYQIIKLNEEAESFKTVDKTSDEADLASDMASYNGDQNTAQANVQIKIDPSKPESDEENEEDEEQKDRPGLDDFFYMLQITTDSTPSFSYIVEQYENLPKKPKGDRSKKKWLSAYLADNTTSRRYAAAQIQYNGRNVFVIDVERDSRVEGLSVIIIAMSDNSPIQEKTIYDIMVDLVKENSSWLHNITIPGLIHKTIIHPSNNAEDSIKNWSNRLLNAIKTIDNHDR